MKILILILMAASALAGELPEACSKVGCSNEIRSVIRDGWQALCDFHFREYVISKGWMDRPRTPAGSMQSLRVSGSGTNVLTITSNYWSGSWPTNWTGNSVTNADIRVHGMAIDPGEWHARIAMIRVIRETNVVDTLMSCYICDRTGLSIKGHDDCWRRRFSEEKTTVREIKILKLDGHEYRLSSNIVQQTTRQWRKAEVKEYID